MSPKNVFAETRRLGDSDVDRGEPADREAEQLFAEQQAEAAEQARREPQIGDDDYPYLKMVKTGEPLDSVPDSNGAELDPPPGTDDSQFGLPAAPTTIKPPSSTPTDPPTTPKDNTRRRLLQSTREFVAHYVPPDYLIEGLMQKRYFYCLTAKTGGGKTSIALLLVALVALARMLGNRQCEKGRVLYFAGENADDPRARWIAMSQQMDFDRNTIDVHWIDKPLKISQAIPAITAEVKELGGVDMIVVDTSTPFFEGNDENDGVQMLAHAKRLRSLTELPGQPCVLVLCHPVKNATDDNLLPRGGGTFVNESDGNFTAVKVDSVVTMHWQGKYRGVDFAPLSFRLRTVSHEELKDSKGRLVPTVVAELLSAQGQEELEKIARGDEDRILEALAKSPRLSTTELAKELGWFMHNRDPYRSRAQRGVTRLKKAKLVELERGRYVLTAKGEKTAKRGEAK